MKKWKGILLGLLCSFQMASAQVIEVEGMGMDEDSARRDAVRSAVESVAGTYIASKTLVENFQVTLDEIYAQAQGFVTNVEVLSVTQGEDGCRMRARVDVDTNPNAKLMNRLNTIVMLNDPRIAVVVLDKEKSSRPILSTSNVDDRYESTSSHDLIVEEALNERLLDVGFTHVVDANQVARLRNSELLNSIYRGTTALTGESGERPIDYLVLGKCKADAYNIRVPDGKGSYRETLLQSARAVLEIRLIDYATGNIVGTFSAEGQGVENTQEMAQNKAKQAAAAVAAQKLEEKFHKAAAKAFQGLQVTAKVSGQAQAERLMTAIRGLPGVQNVYFREMSNGKVVLDVDSAQKPHVLARMLQEQAGLNIYVLSVSSSELKISMH